MTIIDKNGERPVCDRCHRVRVKIRRGSSICNGCREIERAAADHARRFYARALAVQAEQRRTRRIIEAIRAAKMAVGQ